MLQEVTIAALLIATKFEDKFEDREILNHIPSKDLVWVSDDCCTVKQLHQTEAKMLKALNYELAVPTVNVFLTWYQSMAEEQDVYSLNLTRYIADLVVIRFDARIIELPSDIALACILVVAQLKDSQSSLPERLCRFYTNRVDVLIKQICRLLQLAPFEQGGLRTIEPYKSFDFAGISSAAAALDSKLAPVEPERKRSKVR